MTAKKKLASLAVVLFLGACCTMVRADDASKAEYLSDLLSDRMISCAQDWGELRLDAAAGAPGQQAPKLRIKDKAYKHGLGHHASSEIVVNLGEQFKTFQAEVGVQWQGGNTPGSVVFQAFVDDKKVFDSGIIRENDRPRPVAVSVEGASELRLVTTDAGDGIAFDSADWADARLVRNPAAAKERPESAIDVAPFGRIVSWDPKGMTGTKAGRVQEFPAEDVAPYKELLASVDGAYQVPVKSGQGCIGLLWLENRLLRRVVLQFPDKALVPPADSVQLQYWIGESAWQGTWQRAEIVPKQLGNSLVWSFGYKQLPRGTQKVRWVFAANSPHPNPLPKGEGTERAETKQPIVLKGISAFTRSRFGTVDLRVESTRPNTDRKAEIELYNGILLDPTEKSPYRRVWDSSKPLSLKVRYNVPQRSKVDRTVLRFQLPDAAFGVAIEDLLANDCVYVPDAGVFVTRMPAPVTLADYLQKIAGQKTVLERVREKPDQDFPRVWSVVHNPIQDLGPMMISLACDNRKFIIEREGAVWFDEFTSPDDPQRVTETPQAIPRQWQLLPQLGSGQVLRLTRHLQGDWLPIPVTTAAEGQVDYRQTAYVAPMSEPAANAPFWLRDRAMCVAEYQVKNNGHEAAEGRLALKFANEKQKTLQLQEVKEGTLVIQGDHVMVLIDTRKAASLAVKREADGLVLSGTLPAGVSAQCFVLIPAWKVALRDYGSLLDGKGSLLSQVESYWNALLKPSMQIETPDAFLNNIIKASQVHCMLAGRCEDRGKRISAWAGSDRYGHIDSESNALIRGMDMNGQTDFARRSLDFMLRRCNKEGFITTGYTMVGTGEILWTLGEHYDRTRDHAWARKIAPELARISQWIARQRKKTKLLDARGQKVPEYGLMPPGVTADWNRYAFRLFNDSQFFAGLDAAARMLADIGDPAAPAIWEEAKQYREGIARAFHSIQARTPIVKLDNGTWAPGDPAFMDCFGRVEDFLPIEDGNRTWCYSIEIGSHHLAATGVLDPASKDADWMADYLEDVQFLRTGYGDYPEANNRKDVFSFGGFAKLQPYYCRIAEVYAMRDDVKPFIRSYFNTIPTLVSKENLSFWEHFANQCAWNKTHETGWFLCQTRTMFVTEHGDELWLAPFVTNHWMKEGMKVALGNAPTRFGKVGYTIASHVAKGEIEAVVQLPKEFTAKRIVLRLRHPEGKPIQSVTVQGKTHADFDPIRETITLAPIGETITVQAKY
jgi:hypothetical protein